MREAKTDLMRFCGCNKNAEMQKIFWHFLFTKVFFNVFTGGRNYTYNRSSLWIDIQEVPRAKSNIWICARFSPQFFREIIASYNSYHLLNLRALFPSSFFSWKRCIGLFIAIFYVLQAEEITLTIGQAFELAYKKFLESKGKDLEKEKQSMVMHKRIELLENENKELKKRLTDIANIKGDNDVKQYMRENNVSAFMGRSQTTLTSLGLFLTPHPPN